MLRPTSKLAALLLVMVAALHAADAFCNPVDSQQQTDNSCECTNPDQLYNYRDNICQDETSFYSNNECGPHAKPESGGCVCEDGWSKRQDGLCYGDVNNCKEPSGCNEENDEICVNVPGSKECICNQEEYRQNSNCNPLDESTNPQWHDCPQEVRDANPGFECLCFDRDMYSDTKGDGRYCELKPGYKNCTSDSDLINNTVCVINTETDIKEYFGLPGYLNNGTDIDECIEKKDKIDCWVYSTCVNDDGTKKGGVAGYHCECDLGYTDSYLEDYTSKQCRVNTGPSGEGLATEDLCEDLQCGNDELCHLRLPTSGDLNQLKEPECVRSLEAAVAEEDPSVSLFTGSLTINNDEPITAGFVTLALEVVLGEGVVTATTKDTKEQGDSSFALTIMTSNTLLSNATSEDVLSLLQEACAPIKVDKKRTYCRLPDGIISKKGSISLDGELESCNDASVCSGETHECEDIGGGRYRCMCKEDGLGTFDMVSYIEDCRAGSGSNAEDEEYTDYLEGVVIGLSVTLGLVCLAAIGLAIYMFVMN